MRVGLIGAGVIGEKRAKVIVSSKQDSLVAIHDVAAYKSQRLARKCGSCAVKTAEEIFNDNSIDIVVVATINKFSSILTQKALEAGKHVLCEKPLGITYQEARKVHNLARRKKLILKVGFNHRFHPAIQKAFHLAKGGVIGKLFYIRAVYGHGGRKGYDREWRMVKKLSGGGELVDQGIHLIDLGRWFLGEFDSVSGAMENFFWSKTTLEDNAFCCLKSKKGALMQLHVSNTQWKNKFLFEVFGSKGYLIVDGLGKSYGRERLIVGVRKALGEKPIEKIFPFRTNDVSWKNEWNGFRGAITNGIEPLGSSLDGMMANKIIEALYKASKIKRAVFI